MVGCKLTRVSWARASGVRQRAAAMSRAPDSPGPRVAAATAAQGPQDSLCAPRPVTRALVLSDRGAADGLQRNCRRQDDLCASEYCQPFQSALQDMLKTCEEGCSPDAPNIEFGRIATQIWSIPAQIRSSSAELGRVRTSVQTWSKSVDTWTTSANLDKVSPH